MLRFLVGSTSWAGVLLLFLQKFIWGEVVYQGWQATLLATLFLLIVCFLVVVEISLQARKYQTLKEMMK